MLSEADLLARVYALIMQFPDDELIEDPGSLAGSEGQAAGESVGDSSPILSCSSREEITNDNSGHEHPTQEKINKTDGDKR